MRIGFVLRVACGLPFVATALAACGGDTETPLFPATSGGAAGAAGSSAGSAGTSAAGASAQAGAAGKSGAAGKGGTGGTGGSGGGSAGVGGSGGASGKGGGQSGQAGSAGKAGGGGAAGKAGASGAAAGGQSGAAGNGGATGIAGSAGNGSAGDAGANAGGQAGQAGSGGGAAGAAGGTAGAGGSATPCGNGVIDADEKCDGKELGGATCNSLLGGGTVGTLTCRNDCSFDTSGCGVCGNGKIDPGEECEDGPDVASGRCGSDCRIKCPDDGKAFGGHCYSRDGTARNWDTARKNCENKKGHLVTITSAAENAVVDGLVGNSFADHWIGFSDGGTEGTFVWVTNEAASYTNWDNNEPNDFANSEDCAHIGNNGKWGDGGCQVPRPSICEIDEPLKK